MQSLFFPTPHRIARFLLLVLLVTECTFSFFEWAKLTVPKVGTISPTDIAFAGLALLLVRSLKDGPRWLRFVDVVSILLGFWILVAGAYLVGTQALPTELFLRRHLRLSLIWLCFPVIRVLDARIKLHLGVAALFLGFVVACIHDYIVLNHRADLMENWYYLFLGLEGHPDRDALKAVLYADLLANWPSGGSLVSALAVVCVVQILQARCVASRLVASCILIAPALACVLALSRGRVLAIFVVSPLALLFLRGTQILPRAASLWIVLGGLAVCVFSAPSLDSPAVREIQRKFLRWFEEDPRQDTSVQIRFEDSLQASREIAASPFVGTGQMTLHEVTTFLGADIHGVLTLGLVAGLPAVLLLAIFVGSVLRAHSSSSASVFPFAFCVFVHYLFLLLANVDSTITVPRSVIPFLLSAALLCSASNTDIVAPPTLPGRGDPTLCSRSPRAEIVL
ncbi:MAG: hypothetical protein KA354_19255 [Phycisphaerae bacterium]|nr:hypothetical protein [Phycisphaerae bacterium]